ncbi:MAG: hypothetical protein K2M87_08040, partial [Muribaculaceae bacterium]|nr:hypothetical protein [Muribaculaceae bacterium]
DKMWELLKIHPGAVSPLGLIHDTEHKVRLIIDSDLKDIELYACHPCVNTSSVAMKLQDLIDKVLPAMGHTPTWVTLLPE